MKVDKLKNVKPLGDNARIHDHRNVFFDDSHSHIFVAYSWTKWSLIFVAYSWTKWFQKILEGL